MTPRQACPRPEGFGRNLRSKTRWFTGFCNSHQVSHFATFFIDARAEISVAESRLMFYTTWCRAPTRRTGKGRARLYSCSLAQTAPGFVVVPEGLPVPPRREGLHPPARARGRRSAPSPAYDKHVRWSLCWAGFDNDPSAGSPTETLLRLLLPLNDKVQWTSRDVADSEPPTSPRSENFTGPFNR